MLENMQVGKVKILSNMSVNLGQKNDVKMRVQSVHLHKAQHGLVDNQNLSGMTDRSILNCLSGIPYQLLFKIDRFNVW